MAQSSAEGSAGLICIADDLDWADAVSQSAGDNVRTLSWAEFDESALELAASAGIALAYLAPSDVPLDWRLGNLCRTFPKGVVVELSLQVAATDEQFFAYGFRKFANHASQGDERVAGLGEFQRDSRCFEFQLSNYKLVPDWLNARFWAHPERFHL